MTNPIVRVYESEQQARDAAGSLKDEGFRPEDIYLLTPASGEELGLPPTAVSDAILAGRTLGKHASRYAAYLAEGRSLVAIRPPYGYSQLAINILAGYGPLETEPRPPERSSTAWDEAAPLSSALQLPPLKRNRPAPFSSLLGLKTLSPGGRTSLSSMAGELTSPHFAFFGASRLAREAAPLSSFFHLGTVSRSKGPWRSSLGFPLLSSDPAPLSSAIGLLPLSGGPLRTHPAGFSATLGLPTLSHGRTFLSRLFGELASPHFALFGRSGLSRKAAPLSSLVGLKPLSGKSGPRWRSSFGFPMLMRGSQTSFGFPMLSRSRSVLSAFGELTSPDYALFGRVALNPNPAPLSSLAGLKTLSGKSGARWRRSFGFPILMRGSHTSFGFPLLSDRRSVLSRLFGELTSPHFAFFGRSKLSRKAAPLSSLVGLKTLSGGSGPAWQRSLGFPMLTGGSPTSLGLPLLAPSRGPLLGDPSQLSAELRNPHFAVFGRSELSPKAAPLSSLVGLKTLSDRSGRAWRSSFGIPMVTRGGSPTSLGLPLLARNPAPLSSAFGMRVLSREQ
jgi:hypothetical protein